MDAFEAKRNERHKPKFYKQAIEGLERKIAQEVPKFTKNV